MSETHPPDRKPLREMTPGERVQWYRLHQAELEDFCSYAQRWVKRREGHGTHTQNDDRYAQFFRMAADLLTGLDELRQEAEQQGDGDESKKTLAHMSGDT